MVEPSTEALQSGADNEDGFSLLELAIPLAENLKLLFCGPFLVGIVTLGASFFVAPTFTASTTFLPPQQQSTAVSALSSLGALAGLSGGAVGLKAPADQYVALMQSHTVSDHLIDHFKLMEVYELKYRTDARKALANHVNFRIGKKDGLITVEVDDKSAQRAAHIANRYVEELRKMTDIIAVTEAQQRRKFFENELQQTNERLVKAQHALQASGLTQGALKAEPKAAAEGYARLKAEVTAAEVRLHTLRGSLTDTSPEVQQQQSAVAALRAQLGRLEQTTDTRGDPDYIGKYREFKYQETLFDLFARQYELARVDESREGGLIQVVDSATPPEKKSKPHRSVIAVIATLLAGIVLAGFVLVRHTWRRSVDDPINAVHLARLSAALRGRRQP